MAIKFWCNKPQRFVKVKKSHQINKKRKNFGEKLEKTSRNTHFEAKIVNFAAKNQKIDDKKQKFKIEN